MEDNSFAFEMLKELKAQNKRQHTLIIILIAVIVTMVIGFFLYESQFETVTDEMTIDQMQTNTNNSSMIGEIN
jgi:undecaprenyl pyrophosphate phosphatase UppP